LRFVIPYSGAESKACIEQALRQSNIFIGEQFQLIQNSQLAMTAADFIVMASGTATLEAMLLRKPMLVCYRLAPITYAIASRIVNVPHMALPNLLAGQRLVPELVQDEVTVTAIRDEILRSLTLQTSKLGWANSSLCIVSCEMMRLRPRLLLSKVC
jgi:lipid-A-disaccharide synthase